MSEYEEQYTAAPYLAPMGALRMALNWIGAIASITLIAGLVYWVFQLGSRNPNEIPIIRAMEGPARTQPESPGGTQANHQGLAVNAVQSEGVVEKPTETVILAPKQQSLTQEDLTQSELAKVQPELRATPQVEQTAVTENSEPVIQDTSLITESIVIETQSTVVASSPYAPLQSIIPHSRPVTLNQKIQAATPVAASPTVSTIVPKGTRLVQLGAYDSEAIAAKEWIKLNGKHGDLLEGKERLIQVATSGGRQFYRLRAVGFENVEESRNLCSALLARGTPCIPVSAR